MFFWEINWLQCVRCEWLFRWIVMFATRDISMPARFAFGRKSTRCNWKCERCLDFVVSLFSLLLFSWIFHVLHFTKAERKSQRAQLETRGISLKNSTREEISTGGLPGGKAEATFGKESSSCAAAAGREKATMQLGTCFPRFASRHASRCSHKVGGKVKDRCRCRSVDGEGVVTVSGNAGC